MWGDGELSVIEPQSLDEPIRSRSYICGRSTTEVVLSSHCILASCVQFLICPITDDMMILTLVT